MSLCNSRKPFLLFTFLFFLMIFPSATPLYFKFSSFNGYTRDIHLEGTANISKGALQITGFPPGKNRVGQAWFTKPMLLKDKATRNLTDFNTHFSFNTSPNQFAYGNGLAFFLAPEGSSFPLNETSYLGSANHNFTSNNTGDRILAIEFNAVNPSSAASLNISNITYNEVCVPFDNTTIAGGRIAKVWISYNSTTLKLSVFLTYAENPVFLGNSTVSYPIGDLVRYFPDSVYVGFAAASGSSAVSYSVLKWEFNSTLDFNGGDLWKKLLIVAVPVAGVSASIVIVLFILWKHKSGRRKEGSHIADAPIDNEFEKNSGPKKYTYGALVRSTNNFAKEGKLGEGGFGAVYRGFLPDQKKDVAVKKVSKKSKQGVKEFASEVRIISRLRHRNLVQLVGWCQQKEELLLVYEFMPNGSLDSHLFKAKTMLTWEVRNRIVLGLASALLYLHEEWDQCVIHRDIKSSNIMLDSNFNAKLGDFGLARLIDHEKTSRTTVWAGTLGYMAPETALTWKASKESDVYSFGIVALEIASGRRCVEPKAEEGQMVLLEWVWELYGKGKLLKAADPKFNMDFEKQQMDCLLIVGLWCAHPDYKLRPSIRQAMQVLKFEASLPVLPPSMPVSTYAVPPSVLPPSTRGSTSHGEPIGITDFEMGRT
ncbi:L-type lectin-domain containing receptor kinase IX.1-like [Macadamia integrifolia]|uniref:L-type lectin-domain containing receptor kinase IX.1-like n=1 Tax=Macadamia integrifolia TaxID=60698 RepID=UPI001C4F206A|nr:L-type lectin-domain containing receptor kinase IX.1-like [Macadamia integrifolia]